MKNLKKIETSLTELSKDFNSQLEVLGKDSKGFHNALIELTAKYPDHKELIQFIVFVNDKLEINQTMFGEVVVDSFNEMIKIKKDLVSHLIDENEDIKVEKPKELTFMQDVISKMKTLKDVKIISMSIAIIFIVLGAYLAPEVIMTILTALAKLFV